MQENYKSSPETTSLQKSVNELKREVEQVKNVVYAAKEILTLEEAALFMGVTRSMLYKLTHRQEIPFYKPNNKMVYFEKSELVKWLRRNPVASRGQISEEARNILNNLAEKK